MTGHTQALNELKTVERVTSGGIRVAHVHDQTDADGCLRIDVLVDCSAESSDKSAVRLQDQEPVSLHVSPLYPLESPTVQVPHRRFAGLPHVVWGEYLCLHLGNNDWDPGRGMAGLADRLLTWFEHVAAGTITGPELPWDPPITRADRQLGCLVIHPEIPPEAFTGAGPWLVLAVIEATGGGTYQLRRWLTAPPHDLSVLSGRSFLAVGVVLPQPVNFSYPTIQPELLWALDEQDVPLADCQALVKVALQRNALAWEGDVALEDALPLPLLLIVSPSARHATPYQRAAHVAAWCTHPELMDEKLLWLQVHDQRPSIVTRRDHSRPAGWLAGKRILILGCGALGAPVAEFCVRGDAQSVLVIDNRPVTPGILVRQPYCYDDIGRAKAVVLAERLRRITPAAPIVGWVTDAVTTITERKILSGYDLIVDATASRTVAAALEKFRWLNRDDDQPPLLSLMVGHRCELGVGTLAMPGASGAGVDVLRRLAIAAADDDELHHVLDDFFPDPPRTELFQPEPGCSDPTYEGSAIDLAAVAGQLLNDALTQLRAPLPRDMLAPRRSATVVSSTELGRPVRRLQWGNDLLSEDTEHGYQIRLDHSALADIRLEVTRAADVHGPDTETGGLLLGQIDHASRVAWVSEAPGPPAGSAASDTGLLLDPTTAKETVHDLRTSSRGLISYIGAWHTHPSHAAIPSAVDIEAMEQFAREGGPVLLLIIAGGGPGGLTGWLHGEHQPSTYARLFFPHWPPGTS